MTRSRNHALWLKALGVCIFMAACPVTASGQTPPRAGATHSPAASRKPDPNQPSTANPAPPPDMKEIETRVRLAIAEQGKEVLDRAAAKANEQVQAAITNISWITTGWLAVVTLVFIALWAFFLQERSLVRKAR